MKNESPCWEQQQNPMQKCCWNINIKAFWNISSKINENWNETEILIYHIVYLLIYSKKAQQKERIKKRKNSQKSPNLFQGQNYEKKKKLIVYLSNYFHSLYLFLQDICHYVKKKLFWMKFLFSWLFSKTVLFVINLSYEIKLQIQNFVSKV
jgi:hypothetical protein